MLCFLTARKLKPGSFERFRQAWEPPEWDPRFVRAYHVRKLEDGNEVSPSASTTDRSREGKTGHYPRSNALCGEAG